MTHVVPLDHSDKARAFWGSVDLMATPEQKQRLHIVLDEPLSCREVVVSALTFCTFADRDILAMADECGMVKGDWRRAAVRTRINDLSKLQPKTETQPQRTQRKK
jgi:hypothetical protein